LIVDVAAVAHVGALHALKDRCLALDIARAGIGHGDIEGDVAITQRCEHHVGQSGQAKTPLHKALGETEPLRDIGNGRTFALHDVQER
jgi:hypothetical protein